MTEPFERYPALATWIERLANTPTSLTLGDWMVFIGALNQAIIAAERRASTIPPGFWLAPDEPTEEMIEAYCSRLHELGAWVNASVVYRAMRDVALRTPND